MLVDLHVLVPADRLADFEVALGRMMAGQGVPERTGGSSREDWLDVVVEITADDVPDFYATFSDWLKKATAASPMERPLSDLDAATFRTIWDVLPSHEQEVLRLLADDFGRTVAWSELEEKLRFSGKPSLARELPTLSAKCAEAGRRMPIRLELADDDAVLILPTALIDIVRQMRKNDAALAAGTVSTGG